MSCVCVFGHLVSFRTNNVTVTGYSSFTPRLRVGGKDKQRQKNSNKGKKKTYKKKMNICTAARVASGPGRRFHFGSSPRVVKHTHLLR